MLRLRLNWAIKDLANFRLRFRDFKTLSEVIKQQVTWYLEVKSMQVSFTNVLRG